MTLTFPGINLTPFAIDLRKRADALETHLADGERLFAEYAHAGWHPRDIANAKEAIKMTKAVLAEIETKIVNQ